MTEAPEEAENLLYHTYIRYRLTLDEDGNFTFSPDTYVNKEYIGSFTSLSLEIIAHKPNAILIEDL
ncbi:hypothetical protein [Cytobacillus gottheilii]|uniref:hypothetical protein n=1 Tax=Cytobacillus gottheilii TaxID=859144 RepID=UPI0009BA34BC|nr:hypothetical protein [Cytobacillus gottheilii]